ncbi:MAG: FkbM family methyltransferase [Bacteroidetes bacterium]|nr:FkbM family methyltransferase [Bacteroidota bacterium]
MKKFIRIIWLEIFGKLAFPILKMFYSPQVPISRKLRFIGKFPLKTSDGKRFYLFNNAFLLETNIFWLGIDEYSWEKMTRNIWMELCKSSDIIFDIGANSGIFSVLAKTYNPKSKVFSFEPQPNIFYVLKKNNNVNGFDIHCENIALADREGSMPFYNSGEAAFTTENTTAGSLNKEWRTERQNSIMVAVKELKRYVEENQIKNIDLIKIDVETFEYEVLLGYGKYLQEHKPALILEIQDRIIGKNIESLLQPSAYTFYNIDEERGLIRTNELGTSTKNHNYLLCPQSKRSLVSKFIIA